MSVELTDEQIALLRRLRKRPVVFTGRESDEERLAMLQLYAARLVIQVTNPGKQNAMEWHITGRGLSLSRSFDP